MKTNWQIKKLGEIVQGFLKSFVLLLTRKKTVDVVNPIKIEQQEYPVPQKDVINETINIIQQEAVVKPILQLTKGDAYLADNSMVEEIRQFISDEFGLGKSKDCLNCTEYVQFRVKQKLDIDIKWPIDRPRHGGKWAFIFEKNNLYKILNFSKINCAVSFTAGIGDNSVGHIAFVEKVNDDGSIEISEANWPNQGKFNKRCLTTDQWKNKYKCRFIDFT